MSHTHLPSVTNDSRMMVMLQEDHQLFNSLNLAWGYKEGGWCIEWKEKKGTEIETDD